MACRPFFLYHKGLFLSLAFFLVSQMSPLVSQLSLFVASGFLAYRKCLFLSRLVSWATTASSCRFFFCSWRGRERPVLPFCLSWLSLLVLRREQTISYFFERTCDFCSLPGRTSDFRSFPERKSDFRSFPERASDFRSLPESTRLLVLIFLLVD